MESWVKSTVHYAAGELLSLGVMLSISILSPRWDNGDGGDGYIAKLFQPGSLPPAFRR